MNKILDFFKSLIVPKDIVKYRYMSALISIFIFVLSVYLITLPMAKNVTDSIPEMKNRYNYQALIQIEENLDNEDNLEVIQSFNSLGCSVVDAKLECKNIGENETFDKTIVFTINGITKKINFLVDLSVLEAKEKDMLVDLKDVPYEDNVEVYFLKFFKDSFYFQAHQQGIEEEEIKHNNEVITPSGYHAKYIYIQDFTLEFDEASARSIGNYLVDILVDLEVQAINSFSIFPITLFIFILPLIFVLIFWLTFRKNGKLKTIKEYYNIAAIVSIIPVIITFITLWFWSDFIKYYMYLFSLMYLFILYKINNSPDEI